jgi:hypothetical protein
VPRPGTDIYVPTSLYLSHGVDDFQGGLAQVYRVEQRTTGGQPALFVSVVERPGVQYNWAFLKDQQDALREHFGTRRARPDPDYSVESNTWD